jgi:hypothetical protein
MVDKALPTLNSVNLGFLENASRIASLPSKDIKRGQGILFHISLQKQDSAED